MGSVWDTAKEWAARSAASTGQALGLPEMGISETINPGNWRGAQPWNYQPKAAQPTGMSFQEQQARLAKANAAQQPTGAAPTSGSASNISGDLDMINQEYEGLLKNLSEQAAQTTSEAGTYKKRIGAQYGPAQKMYESEKQEKLATLGTERERTGRVAESAIQRTARNLGQGMSSLRSQLGVIGATSSSAMAGLGERLYSQALEQTGNVVEARDTTLREISTRVDAANQFFAGKLSQLQQEIANAQSDIDIGLQRELGAIRADKRQAEAAKRSARMQAWQNYNASRQQVASQAAYYQSVLAQSKAKIEADNKEAQYDILRNFPDIDQSMAQYSQRTGQQINIPAGSMGDWQGSPITYGGGQQQKEDQWWNPFD